ncbi:hypothetical protein AX769_13555 [Frondihabitans sp. PAMC 28766]|uniref:hypothetical protein n=1 Tax=Frondihabitans sp. PAMC 28766 TaxID=1795630 RepID=UPI00078BAA6F|nr:hypothetical protein [Frondihabitans sp. PAMC 28766]AMM20971.1 hypothetical protein AX769_13555 [Frondihabitans sp. PAMC 28766]
MAKKPRAQSLAEIAAELRADLTASRKPPPRPGVLDDDGNLVDLNGTVLSLVREELSSSAAATAVENARAVAVDSCGCGGSAQGCRTEWLSPRALEALRSAGEPVLGRTKRSLAWIDEWHGPTGAVLFLHGDVEW